MLSNSSEVPMVTVIVPVYNEEQFIGRCLQSLLEQDYPENRMEIIIIDGNSSDGTVEAVKALMDETSRIRVFANPKRIIPAAINLGISHAIGEIVVRADAHNVYDPGYIRHSVKLLQQSGAANVGGVIEPKGEGLVGSAIASAVSSPFGVGNAYYRFSRRERWVDTVPFGCWFKRTLTDLGGYNESYHINEDYELNYRIRKNGGKILLSPEIRSIYYPRSSFKALAKQYYRYGKWKVKTLVEHPESMAYRQAIAPIFVFALTASMAFYPYSIAPLLFVAIPYLLANLAFSSRIALRQGMRNFPMLPFAFFVIHVSWGAGFFSGLRAFGIPAFIRSFRFLKAHKVEGAI